MDPASNTYVILLANAIHPRGNPPISTLRGQVATAAAKALGLNQSLGLTIKPQVVTPIAGNFNRRRITNPKPGIDVLESTHYTALAEATHRHNNTSD